MPRNVGQKFINGSSISSSLLAVLRAVSNTSRRSGNKFLQESTHRFLRPAWSLQGGLALCGSLLRSGPELPSNFGLLLSDGWEGIGG